MPIELEERFRQFALRVRNFCLSIKNETINKTYIDQLIRASGSVGANYIEASDSLGKADERMKLKISRREAKESAYWQYLVFTQNHPAIDAERLSLLDEAQQINRILSAIIQKLS